VATPKAAKNAAKAAASKGDAAAKAGDVNPFALPKGETAMRNIAQQLKISTGQVKDLYGSIIPELQAAGTPNATIKGFLQQQDPHLAAKQYLAGEKAELVDQLVALNAGFTPESLAKTPLRELWTTFEDASKPAQERASNIRGQVDEPPNTESRLPGKDTATADANLGETPKPEAADAPKGEGGPPNAKDRKRVKWEQRQKNAANAATAREGNWEGVDWQGSNRDSSYAGRTAADGDWSRLKADDFTGERNSPNPTIERNQGSAPPPPPGGGGPPGGPPDDLTPPELPNAVKNSRILATAKGAARNIGNNWFDYAIGGAVVGVPTAYGLGYFGKGQQPAQGQQQQSPAGGGPRIQILPRSELQRRESMPPARQAAPPMQQPMSPQQAAPASPSPGQTTDIIRMLSGRMA
jgi:hypothetical protein